MEIQKTRELGMGLGGRITMILGTVLAFLGPMQLVAQELSFGGQATLSRPQGDLAGIGFLDHQLGAGLGLRMGVAFPGGHVIVPRVDYLDYRRKGSSDARVWTCLAGVDYLYYLAGRSADRGTYLGVGLGYGFTHYRQQTASGFLSDTASNVYYAGELGYRFNRHLGAELRDTFSEYSPGLDAGNPTIHAPAMDGSLIVGF